MAWAHGWLHGSASAMQPGWLTCKKVVPGMAMTAAPYALAVASVIAQPAHVAFAAKPLHASQLAGVELVPAQAARKSSICWDVHWPLRGTGGIQGGE